MCDPISAIVGASLLATGASVYTAEKARSQQGKAMQQAQAQAANAAKQNEIESNRANARSPDLNAIMGRNASGNAGGVGSTMLTGPQGVTGGMSLAPTSLLGM